MQELLNKPKGQGLVGIDGLMLELFPNPKERPSIRWAWDRQKDGTFPSVKIGRLIFFDVDEVRRAINKPRAKR